MLLQWETQFRESNSNPKLRALPEVLYAQIDGGSENANKATLAICELMIARGLTRKIVLTRLPVGHTHEDIDARFGVIWRKMYHSQIYTPQGISFQFFNIFQHQLKLLYTVIVIIIC
jgi:hypothetical protein